VPVVRGSGAERVESPAVDEAPLPQSAAPPDRRERWRSSLAPWLAVLGLYAASRVVLALVLAVAALGRPDLTFRETAVIWDGGWYVLAAEQGWPASLAGANAGATTAVFFPGYPALIRLLTGLTPLGSVEAGVLVSLVAGAVAVCLVWRLVDLLSGREVADRAAALLCFAPGAFVLSLVYAEALMLALAAGCLLALHRQQWLLAGLLAAAATATRPNAAALCLACAAAAVPAAWRGRTLVPLSAVVLSPLGLVAFFAFLWHRTGNPGEYFRVQRDGFAERIDGGVHTLRLTGRFLTEPFADVHVFITGTTFLAMLVLSVLLLRARLPLPLVVYALTVVVLVSITHTVGPRPRFLLVAFPLLVPLAIGLRGRAFAAAVGVSAVLMSASAFYYVTFFVLADLSVQPP
jgi:hypothetical protein